jgi:membrane-associated protein
MTALLILSHLDQHLIELIRNYGTWIYLILFLIIFCETGLVVAPFLPGDSLLFVAGAVAASGGMDIGVLVALLIVAAVAGDTLNYGIGHYLGPKVFHYEDSRFFRKAHLEKAHRFYEKHGGKTIIIARFVPIIRTFGPFVAGIGRMNYGRFVSYNIIGGVAWILSFVLGGYYFGNLPIVKNNLTLIILLIIVISLMPGIIGYLKSRRVKAAGK